jgi:integrase
VKRKSYIASNPVTDVKPPRLPEKDIRYLKLREIDGCLEAVKGHRLESLIACAIYSGLRREELCWLAWDDIDLTEGKPLLRIRMKSDGDITWMPKTKRNRFVPIHSRLVPYLAAARMRMGEIPWVFTSPEGCRWNPDNLGHRLAKLMDAVRLVWTFLDFRHTYGSQLAMKGVSIFKIAKLMGNSARVAEKHYAALQTQDLHKDIEFGVEPQEPKARKGQGKPNERGR